MSLILVVEKDADFINRLAVVLRARGHTVDAATSCEAGWHQAEARRPQLLLVSGALPGAPKLLGKYARRNGGPGSAVLVPARMADQVQADQFAADVVLPKPLEEKRLVALLEKLLAGASAAGEAGALPNVGAQLTSEQIFGDVLAEVEADVAERRPGGSSSPPATPATPAASAPAAGRPATTPPPSPPKPAASPPPPSPQTPAAASPPPQAPAATPPPRRRAAAHDDIDRKLEETLSGFFPDKLKRPAGTAPKPRRTSVPSADEIEDLLDKTLSSLELPSRTKKARKDKRPAAAKPAATSAPASTPTSAPRPAAPASEAAGPPPATPPPAPTSPPQTDPPRPDAARPDPAGPGAAGTPAATPPAPEPLPSFTQPLPPPPPPPPGPRPAASDSSLDMPSAAETLRLDAPLVPEGTGEAAFDPPPEQGGFVPPKVEEPFEPPVEEDGDGLLPAPEEDGEDIFGRSGTFDLPSLEPLPEDAPPPVAEESWSPSPDGLRTEAVPWQAEQLEEDQDQEDAPAWGAEESAPEDAAEEPLSEPAEEPEVAATASAGESTGFGDFSAGGGWSVSSFDEGPTPDLTGSSAAPPPPSAPTEQSRSFMLHDQEPENEGDEAVDYPTDFASAFSLPPGGDEPGAEGADAAPSSFSPDPTETVDAEDTAGLQRTLEGVLQIRDGAATPSEKAGVPFGDYRLLERVAVGGMAEVWRAQRRGVEGFQKTVAIKKILSHLTGSSDFVTMFIDEAKLAAQLSHANIIQIYDLGKVEDDFFIAMEFVDGKDLRTIQNQARDAGEELSLGLCLMIVAALARALDYAHRKRDFENRALGLVHRDVSPQNVLISYEGEIKLCDFGIVKAVAKASTTQMGALKGKLQYMSPEQAWGKEVDARSDIFSLGSVLFEVLTGERLFTGDSEIGVLDAVRDCRIRSPRELNGDVPPAVEAIVLKALAPTPEERYQTAGEMERDIAAVLEDLKPAVGQSDLAALMTRLFGVHKIAESGSFLPPEEPRDEAEEAGQAKETLEEAKPKKDAKERTGASSRTWLIAAIVLLALAAVVAILVMTLGGEDGPAPAPPPAVSQPAPPGPLGEPGAAEAPGAAADGAAQEDPEPADLEKLLEEAVASEKEKMDADFEARRQRLEEELRRVQEGSGEGGGGG